MYSRLNKGNLDFYLGQTQIHGVQDMDASYQLPIEHTKFLGMGQSYYTPNGPQIGSLSITSFLSPVNDFLAYTGDFGTFGYITRKNNPQSNILFGFTSGYLTNYNLSCQLGQIPVVKADFSIFDDAGKIPNNPTALNTTPTPTLANSNSLGVTISEFQSNRLTSLNFNISVQRYPIYYLGNRNPAIVTPAFPIEVTCDFTMAPDQYNMQSISLLPFSLRNNNFAIFLNDFTGRAINLDFTNRLTYFTNVSEQATYSVNSSNSIVIKYRGYFK